MTLVVVSGESGDSLVTVVTLVSLVGRLAGSQVAGPGSVSKVRGPIEVLALTKAKLGGHALDAVGLPITSFSGIFPAVCCVR